MELANINPAGSYLDGQLDPVHQFQSRIRGRERRRVGGVTNVSVGGWKKAEGDKQMRWRLW